MAVDTKHAIRWLTEFNARAAELRESRFSQVIFTTETTVRIHYTSGAGITTTSSGPDDEAVKALVLTLRFFKEKKERISVLAMSELYEDLPIPEELKQEWRTNRIAFNKMLDEETFITEDGIVPTQRRILEVFLYGKLAHMNEERYETHRMWLNIPPMYNIKYYLFLQILGAFINYIHLFSEINDRTLLALSAQL